jgi:hypothetical protein
MRTTSFFIHEQQVGVFSHSQLNRFALAELKPRQSWIGRLFHVPDQEPW